MLKQHVLTTEWGGGTGVVPTKWTPMVKLVMRSKDWE